MWVVSGYITATEIGFLAMLYPLVGINTMALTCTTSAITRSYISLTVKRFVLLSTINIILNANFKLQFSKVIPRIILWPAW